MQSYHSFDAYETNVFRIWEKKQNRNFHIKTLNTIYKEKEMLKNKSDQEIKQR